MGIEAKETIYNGYKFRSRLEARWAVFFDYLRVEYEYEPEGFQLSNGESYLPDFFLPKFKTYVEVKPAHHIFIDTSNDNYVTFENEFEKYGVFSREAAEDGFCVWFVFGDPVDALDATGKEEKGDNFFFYEGICLARFLSILGYSGDVICNCNGEEKKASECKHNSTEYARTNIVLLTEKTIFINNCNFIPVGISVCPPDLWEILDCNKISDALNAQKMAAIAARQARFEHGETPKFKS